MSEIIDTKEIVTIKDAMKMTGLSQPTINNWAKRKEQKRIGNVYVLSPKFIKFLRTRKPKKRPKILDK